MDSSSRRNVEDVLIVISEFSSDDENIFEPNTPAPAATTVTGTESASLQFLPSDRNQDQSSNSANPSPSHSNDDESEGQSQPQISQSQPGPADIRSRIESARLLLQTAELLSRPEHPTTNSRPIDVSQQSTSISGLHRYGISSNVTPNDFYRERDLSSLCDITTQLQNRLSVERIYNLGPPQCPQERTIFDELLMTRFSDLITGDQDGENPQSTSQSPSLSENQRPLSLSTALSITATQGESNSNSCDGISNSVQALSIVRCLRQYIEDNSETVVADRKLLNVVSEFIQCLKKSPVISSAIVSSPARTPSKSRKRPRNSEDARNEESSEDEEESCTICMEPWTTGGDHRVCCLKCGHMFGYSCISKWIKQAHSCPQCKMTAKIDEIRSLYARKVTAEDTSERDRALKLLEDERSKVRNLEHKEAVARRKVDSQSQLISQLEARIDHINGTSSQGRSGLKDFGQTSRLSAFSSTSGPGPSNKDTEIGYNTLNATTQYDMLARVPIAQDGHCRVFEFSQELGMVVVSTKSSNPLFRGFGIKTLARDFRVLSYQPLHSALIRDLSFRPNTFDGTLLSCGMDKVVQLTSVTSKSVIHKFNLSVSGWCCAWNTTNNNLFYVGMERGMVKEFDIRRTDGPVHQDVMDFGGAPIASVAYWEEQSNGHGTSPIKGVLISQIRNQIFREKRLDEFTTHALSNPSAPVMGSCVIQDGHILTSLRPNVTNQRCKYEVSRLMRGRNDNVFAHRVTSWSGATVQPVISRNCLFSNPDSENQLFAATADHQANKVSVWDVNRGREFQSLNCYNKAVDIKTISANNHNMLGVLSETELVLYKWASQS